MLDQLQEGFGQIIKSLKGEGKITEKNIRDTMRQIRRTLLAADVNYKVVKSFTQRVQEKAIGVTVTKSLSPGQMVVKIIHEELVNLLGVDAYTLQMSSVPPTVIVLAGLQGCGKTTLAAKLAQHFKSKNKSPLLVTVDIYRPAAVEQLEILGKQIETPVYTQGKKIKKRVKAAVKHAQSNAHDLVIIDTAGRLHIDAEMMQELQDIKKAVNPDDILFVADGMTGQDAVNTASTFNAKIDFDAIVLTKMDSDTRGGAALSIVETCGKPIAFISTGEKVSDLEVFHPDRIANRILGMGDIVSLVEKVQDSVNEEEAVRLEKKLRKQQFSLEDYLSQIKQMKKMGPLENILEMIPGVPRSKLKNMTIDDRQLFKTEAIIQSMTPEERQKPDIIKGSRRKRIARGSGTSTNEVNRLLNQYKQVVKMTQQMGKMKIPGDLSALRMGL